MAYLGLSRRAVYDLEEIEQFSIDRWGSAVAARYLHSIELGLELLKRNPNLLRALPEISSHLKFYRVENHFLVCALVEENVYVLTVKHGVMDLPERIGELEPVLAQEVAILHQAFLDSRPD